MKKILFAVIALLYTVSINAQHGLYVGGDISCLPKYETAGAHYLTSDGQNISAPLTFFKDEGMNAMRVRLFVNPQNRVDDKTDNNVCQDLEWVKALGQRIKAEGYKFLLDIHYSDSWADPAKQWTPQAWKSLTEEQLKQKVYDYTKDVLTQLKAAGAEPDMIQTGNEISYGMLWGTSSASASSLKKCYTSSNANWDYFTSLLKKAGSACREVCPKAKIVLHTERVAQPSVLTAFYDKMASYDVDYDIIGLSYYPYHHGSLTVLETALSQLEQKFAGKQIMIVETGYPYAWAVPGGSKDFSSTWAYSWDGQKKFTTDLLATLAKHETVTGLFWWFMEFNPYWTGSTFNGQWYNAPLFDGRNGKATYALSVMKDFLDPDAPADDEDVYGDVNSDGVVDISDINAIITVICGE